MLQDNICFLVAQDGSVEQLASLQTTGTRLAMNITPTTEFEAQNRSTIMSGDTSR
jgi:hypothetical protein